MYAHPGKKLLFMGAELAQWSEWNHDQSLDWHLLEHAPHQGIQRWLKDLNHFYRAQPALYERDFDNGGFEWVDLRDWEQSTISFARKGNAAEESVLMVCNFTPMPRQNYRLGVPRTGLWKEALNSDATLYGGSGHGNFGGVWTSPVPSHGHHQSIVLTLPPLAIVFLKHEAAQDAG
jgi:1,4-alpha-glucan branching enzyme